MTPAPRSIASLSKLIGNCFTRFFQGLRRFEGLINSRKNRYNCVAAYIKIRLEAKGRPINVQYSS